MNKLSASGDCHLRPSGVNTEANISFSQPIHQSAKPSENVDAALELLMKIGERHNRKRPEFIKRTRTASEI